MSEFHPKAFAIALITGLVLAAGVVTWAVTYPAPCDPPPFDQCTPKGSWNAPNCKCWDSK